MAINQTIHKAALHGKLMRRKIILGGGEEIQKCRKRLSGLRLSMNLLDLAEGATFGCPLLFITQRTQSSWWNMLIVVSFTTNVYVSNCIALKYIWFLLNDFVCLRVSMQLLYSLLQGSKFTDVFLPVLVLDQKTKEGPICKSSGEVNDAIFDRHSVI